MADNIADLKKQVADNVSRVDRAYASELFQLDTKTFSFLPQFTNAANAIKALKPTIAAWAKRGQDAAAAGTAPGANGWAGWVKAGQAFIDGFVDIKGSAGQYALADIKDTVKQAPATTAKAVKTTAKAAVVVASKAAEAVGDTVTSGFSTLKWVGVGLVVVVAGLAVIKVKS